MKKAKNFHFMFYILGGKVVMINPIQQNVVFKGVKKAEGTDNFTGNMPVSRTVRGDYANAVTGVSKVQQNMTAINDKAGKNLDTIA